MSDLLPVPREYEYKGQVYQVCEIDFLLQRLFADWVSQEAGLALHRMKRSWPAELYNEQLRLLNTKIISKKLTWGSEDVYSAIWSEEGHRQLLFLKMKRGVELGGAEPERELVDEIAKNTDKWQELTDILYQQDFPDFFAREIAPFREKKKEPSPSQAVSQPAATLSV